MKDILLYISDQHAWRQQGYAGDSLVRTPNLDRLAAEGTVMQNNYTPYPLCVPARMCMMSGRLASQCNVMSNMSALDSNYATFAHCLAVAGYETVLCGRMHFVGGDQRHGFAKRIAGDITPIYQNRPANIAQERGVHDRTLQDAPFCLAAIGGGDSPTLEFDRYVVDKALEYLGQDHEKPQFMCVGTYGPHYPYVAPRELFDYYYEKVDVPADSFAYPEHPALAGRKCRDTDPEIVRAVRAAYYGMVEFEDQKIGAVYDAFQRYLKRTGREGVFVYVSDHGDQIGHRGYYGKATLYEQSAHTPMLFVGDGVAKGRQLHGATSLLDLGPTLCELGGAPALPRADGHSLCNQLTGGEDELERIVLAEVDGSLTRGGFRYGQMAKCGPYKYIHYDGYDAADALYNVEEDPEETVNLLGEHRDLVERMRAALAEACRPVPEIRAKAEELRENLGITMKCSFDNEQERWHSPECARHAPEPMFRSSKCQ